MTSTPDRYEAVSLQELGTLLRARRLTSVELTHWSLSCAEKSSLGSYRTIRRTKAEQEALVADAVFDVGRDLGPLAGIPVSVKDLYGLGFEPIYAGSPKPLPKKFARTGVFLERALDQMCVVIGKTHTVEFAFGGIGINTHWGTPRNPYALNTHRVPGGSSSGAGTSLFEGSAKLAFGTDTAGSVRIPAAWTGAVGVKTTKGRWSTDAIVPLSPFLDTPGILTRTMDDAAYAFAALDGPKATFKDRFKLLQNRPLRGLRIAIAGGSFQEGCSPGVLERVLEAGVQLEARGAVVFEAKLSGEQEAMGVFSEGGPAGIELHQFLSDELPDWFDSLDSCVHDRISGAASVPAQDYIQRLKGLRSAQLEVMKAFEDVDIFMSPTVAITPPLVSELSHLDEYRQANAKALRNTAIVSFLGLCAVTLPCGYDDAGMPVGLQLIGSAGGDIPLLAAAKAVASALPTEF